MARTPVNQTIFQPEKQLESTNRNYYPFQESNSGASLHMYFSRKACFALLQKNRNLFLLQFVSFFVAVAFTCSANASASFCTTQNQKKPLFCQDFETSESGLYDDESLTRDWPGVSYLSNKNGIKHLGIEQQRVSIVHSGKNDSKQNPASLKQIDTTDESSKANHVLRIHYPAGRFGPLDTGATWIVRLPERYNQLTLEYKVRFGEGFLFERDKLIGGKLPGLMGGNSISGNADANGRNGWTARMMWGQKGRGLAYLYYPDMRDQKWNQAACPRFGHGTEKCSIYRNKYFTADSTGRGKCLSEWPQEQDALYFEANRFYTLRQQVRLNSASRSSSWLRGAMKEGERDGILRVWVDDRLMVNCENIRYRDTPSLGIDALLFNTFFGGNTALSSAHPVDEQIEFDDFLITTE